MTKARISSKQNEYGEYLGRKEKVTGWWGKSTYDQKLNVCIEAGLPRPDLTAQLSEPFMVKRYIEAIYEVLSRKGLV